MKKLIASLATAAVLGAGAIGIASVLPTAGAAAQESPDATAPSDGQWQRPGAVILDKALDKLVAQGTITAEQADAVRNAVRVEALDAGLQGGMRRHSIVARGFGVAADTIGIDPATLAQDVRDGQSIAEVAEANGVDAQTVVDALVTAGTNAIDEAVANGRIGEDAAAMLKDRLPEAAQRLVDFKPPTA